MLEVPTTFQRRKLSPAISDCVGDKTVWETMKQGVAHLKGLKPGRKIKTHIHGGLPSQNHSTVGPLFHTPIYHTHTHTHTHTPHAYVSTETYTNRQTDRHTTITTTTTTTTVITTTPHHTREETTTKR